MGHSEVIVKGGNGPALQALMQRALAVLGASTGVDKISDEYTLAYDSQANGGAEVGVVLVRGLSCTLGLGLDAASGERINAERPDRVQGRSR